MLIPVAEAAFLPEPPVVELALLPPVLPPVLPPLDVDPFTSWVTAKNETPASVAHSELFSGAAAARKVISAHYRNVKSVANLRCIEATATHVVQRIARTAEGHDLDAGLCPVGDNQVRGQR